MGKRKIIGTIFLTICMLLSMSLNALVVSAGTPTSGSITIHTYDEVGGHLNDGNKIADESTLGNPIGGISFNVKKVVLGENGPIVDNEGNKYKVDTSYHSNGFTNGEKTVTTSTADKDKGTVTLEDLELGIYYFEEKSGNSYTGYEPFFVQVPMMNVEGDGLIYNVHVYPKPPVFEFEKDVIGESTTPEHGSIITWQISSTIPKDIATADVFKITDVLEDSRLEYMGNVRITSGENGSGDSLADYFKQTYDFDTKTLTITATNFSALAQYEKVYITFDTKVIVSQKDPDKLDGILNRASLEYKNSNGTSFGKTAESEYGANGIIVRKFDSSGKKLEGAEFYIFTDKEAALDAMNGVKGAVDKGLRNPDNTNEPWKVTAGQANFLGLTDGTYYLAETKAPSGYNKLKSPIEVVIDPTSTDSYFTVRFGDGKAAQYELDGQVAVIDVENKPGFTLPVTDGPGIIWFTLIGLLLIGIAMLIYNKSKEKEE